MCVWVETDKGAYAALRSRGERFDLLLLDVDLGEGTTGFDVARTARQLDPEVTVIFCSGNPPDWLDSFGVQNAFFLTKPFSEAALLQMIAVTRLGRSTQADASVLEQQASSRAQSSINTKPAEQSLPRQQA